ncbi:hypothetical protein FDENT_6737 [Fusarium denticulatum]|uniref:Uncharacterized protein n=1 Tax=Fusarium denticulatum TaxID=48507 RepID=A0A8H5UBG1_9HYPO|nr:hypothetical protein FDENT_6737 [Fusarium denticulatum]
MESPPAQQQQHPPSPPPEGEFNKDTVVHHLRGLANQVNLYEAQNQDRAILTQILEQMQALNQRVDEMATGINKRLDKLESFATNTNARAKNARAYEQGVDYTPLVQADGNEIPHFPRTFKAVNSLTDQRVSTLLEALGVDIGVGWDLWKKRSAFLGAIGVLQSPVA